MEPKVTLTDAPDRQAEKVIGEGLRRYNVEQSGVDDSRPLAVIVSDPETGEPIGGLLGRTSRGVLFVDLVFLPDAVRGDGLGRRIVRMAEDEGRRRGCGAAVLYTSSFRAPGFYERHGWRRFGEIPSQPPGTSRIYFTKALA